MLYTKLKTDENSSNNSSDNLNDEEKKDIDRPSILEYYCKNCAYTTEMTDTNTCIYKRNYEEDYIVERVISNKYTIYDNTLPRVNYDCINKDCPTNIDYDELDKEAYIMIDNLPPDYTNDDIETIFLNDLESIEKTVRVKLTKYIIVLKSVADRIPFENKYKNKEIDGYKLNIIDYEKPKKEVIYIKYDNINMKYLYICANCGTSWKKN
jgi:rubrerythrin